MAGTEPTQACTTPTSLQNVLVPSVIGFDEDAGDDGAHCRARGSTSRRSAEASTQPPGTVIYQDPAAGTSTEQTSTVTITIAKPAETCRRVGVAQRDPASTQRHGTSVADRRSRPAVSARDRHRGRGSPGSSQTAVDRADRRRRTSDRSRAPARADRGLDTAPVRRRCRGCARAVRGSPAVRPRAAAPRAPWPARTRDDVHGSDGCRSRGTRTGARPVRTSTRCERCDRDTNGSRGRRAHRPRSRRCGRGRRSHREAGARRCRPTRSGATTARAARTSDA